jgi:RNA polymerase sigma-70 factor, ECF subfamily
MDELKREGYFGPMKTRATNQAAPETREADLSVQSFETLFLEHWPAVYRVLLRLVGDPAEAEDLALETFLQLHRRYPLPAEGFNLGGWLYRVATNLGLRSIRSFRRRERYELAAGKGALDEAPEDRPAEIHDREEQRHSVRVVLAQMPTRQAQLLVLRYSGIAYKEIAQALGLAPASIGPLLLRAEREFEKRYRALTPQEG